MVPYDILFFKECVHTILLSKHISTHPSFRKTLISPERNNVEKFALRISIENKVSNQMVILQDKITSETDVENLVSRMSIAKSSGLVNILIN
jgi:hypothetical protein